MTQPPTPTDRRQRRQGWTQMTPAERRMLARAAAVARANGVPWGVLEHLYGRSREQLWRYMREEDPNATLLAPNATCPMLREHGRE